MNKVLVTVTNIFGKNDGDAELDTFVIEDTPDSRMNIVEEYSWNKEDIYDNVDDFVDSKINTLGMDLVGGDWDEPDGRVIEITTKEEKLNEIRKEYERQVKNIEELFV